MNKIVNKFLLADYKFKPKMHLKQLGFTYSTCGPFTKNKERVKQVGDTSYIYKNDLKRLAFNMIWLMEVLNIWQKEQLLIKV